MSNYTEKLARYLQQAESQNSISSSISSVNQSLHDFGNSNRGSQFTNAKATIKKSQVLCSTNLTHSESISQHDSNVYSPKVLKDITNSNHNNQAIQPKNSYLLNLLPSESISFTNDCKTEPSSLLATRKASDFENNLPLLQGSLTSNSNPQFGNENYPKKIPANIAKQPDTKGSQFLKKTAPAINFSQSSTYNIEDFLPEPTFLRVNDFHSGIGLNSSINVAPQGISYQNSGYNLHGSSNFDQKSINTREQMQTAGHVTHDYGAVGYGNPSLIGGPNSNTGIMQKKVEFKAQGNQNLNESSQIDSSISDGRFSSFTNLGQTQLDHTIASETDGKIDERSREEIRKFIKTSLAEGEKPKNTTNNEYADFLSRILIKLIENIPLLQNQSIKEPDNKKKSSNFSEAKSTNKFHKLRIQQLEAINYVPEKKFRKEGIQVVDVELAESPFNAHYEMVPNKLDKPPIFSHGSAKNPQSLNSKKQSVLGRKNQKAFTMTTDLASLDELSDSSMDHSNQGSETYFRSRFNSIKSRKAQPGWENSKNTTMLSDTMDSELEFDIPRRRGSVPQAPSSYQNTDNQSRFSFKNRSPLDQNSFVQEMRKVTVSASLPKPSSAKRSEYISNLGEDPNKIAGFMNTTARFNGHSTAFKKDKNHSASESDRCFSAGRFSKKNPNLRNSYASGKKTTPFIEKNSRPQQESERKLGTEIKKREVLINENNEVVFAEGPNSQESSMRGQETSGRGFKDAKLTSCTNSLSASGLRSPSPHFNQSKNSSLSKSSIEDWSLSRVQLEYSISNSHVSRMNSLAVDSISRHDSRSGRNTFEAKSAVKSNLDNRKRTESAINEQNDALFKSSLLATADFERNSSDTKILGWRPVRFGSREKVEEFIKDY